MFSNKEIYKKQMDDICKTNTLTAEDILKEFERRENADNKVISFTEKRVAKKNPAWKVAAAAIACVVTVSVSFVGAGAAGYGPLSSLFMKVNDDKTGELAEKGYLYEVNESRSTEGYEATFFGIAGDVDNPMLMMKLTIDDDEFVEEYETIYVTVYEGIEKNTYETNRVDLFLDSNNDLTGSIGFGEVEAKRDEEDHHSYYFSTRSILWEDTLSIVSVRSIRYYPENSEGIFKEIFLNLEFEVTLPASTMKDTLHVYFTDIPTFVGDNGIEYELVFSTLNEYDSQLCIHMQDEQLHHDESMDEQLVEDWKTIEDQLRLVVDGVEYEVATPGYFCCHHMVDTGIGTTAVVNPYFPPVPYETATQIIVTYKGQEVARLK